jgi:hypothetical protein
MQPLDCIGILFHFRRDCQRELTHLAARSIPIAEGPAEASFGLSKRMRRPSRSGAHQTQAIRLLADVNPLQLRPIHRLNVLLLEAAVGVAV